MVQPLASEATEERLLDCLAQYPGVHRAAVTSWTDQNGAPQLVAYVVPSGGGHPAVALADGHLDRWENLWSMLYRQEDAPDPEFDIRGWNSSYTRKPLPAEEMRDWVDETVATIREFELESVLEIGCGSGLLAHRLAPHCRRYVATDFSEAAVARLQRQVRAGDLPDTVEPRQGPAHLMGDIPGQFDMVIVNSVIQYFPTASYLDDVIAQAIAHTSPGGIVFIGDAYFLALREAMQTSIVLEQAAPDAPTELLRSRVLHRIAGQTELLIDPAYFSRLAARSAEVSAVQARPKFGAYDNEMTRFRYDAVVAVGGPPGTTVDVPWHDWQGDGLDAGSLESLLAGNGGGGFGVSGIPNSRVTSWLHRWSALNGGDPAGSPAGMSTADLRALTVGTPYDLHLSCLSARPDGSIDAAWLPAGRKGERPSFPPPASTSGPLANDPLWARATEGLVRELRKHLRDVLGQSVPMTLVCVEEIPPALEAIPGGPNPDRAGAPA